MARGHRTHCLDSSDQSITQTYKHIKNTNTERHTKTLTKTRKPSTNTIAEQ